MQRFAFETDRDAAPGSTLEIPRAPDVQDPKGRRERCRGASTTSTAVMLLVTLATGAALALGTADQTLINSIGYKQETETLMLAESSAEYAMAYLDGIPDWSTIPLPAYNLVPPTLLGHGMIWADVQNDAYDIDPAFDANDMLVIKAHAQLLNATKVKSIEALYWRPQFTIPPVAAVNLCANDVLAAHNGNMRIKGWNHYLPPSPCSGSHCNEERKDEGPDVAGVAFEIPGEEAYADFPRTLEGNPPYVSGVCELRGPTGVCARVGMVLKNLHRIVGIETLAEWPIRGRGTYGSVLDPKLLRVAPGTSLRLSGTSQGAGVLFVQGSLVITGTFTWSGLIIVGPGGVIDQRGTANIFGSVITAGKPDDPAYLYMRGNGSIVWAADAIRVGPFNLPALLSSWREYN